jgi:hypothetical protein
MLRALLALATLSAVTTHAEHAHACSCSVQTAEQAFEHADAVFEGRVTEVTEPAGENGVVSGADPVRITLSVVRAFKGAATETVELLTSASSAACGFGFEKDQSYLVYANETDGSLRTGLCSGTKRVEDAGPELAALGSGVTPVDPSPPGAPAVQAPPRRAPGGGCASCAAGGAPLRGADGVVLTLLVAAALVRRRRDQ